MFENYSGATKIIPIIGHPIAQAKSPFGVTKAFAARAIDAVVVPLDVPPHAITGFLKAMDAVGNLGGILATVPHKFALCAHADILTERAAFHGSANAMRRLPSGEWLADMLDGVGFVGAILKAGGQVGGRHVLLVGAGGAGGAIALELLNAGAASLAVHDTDVGRRDGLIAKLNARHPGRARIGSASPAGYGVVINATPLGLNAGDAGPVRLDQLDASMFVGDVVTARGDTPLIAAAKRAGCANCSGHDMFYGTLDLMVEFFSQGMAAPRT